MFNKFNCLVDYPIFERGFRPFFILGALYSVINLLIWAGFYSDIIEPPIIFDNYIFWHAHEMIFGFTIAIIAGFLLTAVANWTGQNPINKFQLFILCLIWMVGRIVMNIDLGLSDHTIFIINGLFIPMLAISLSIPLIKSNNKRNLIFLVLLTILFICDLTFLMMEEPLSLYIAIITIITMVSLIGGRIIPAFTTAALRNDGLDVNNIAQNKLDILALLSLATIVLHFIFYGLEGTILASIALISAFIHMLRMKNYHSTKTGQNPMLWILHIGYLWIIIGLILISVSAIGFIPFSIALHAFTAGAIGSMTLGMMCRVSLGHTGRNIIANKVTIAIFILIQIAAVIRVFCVLAMPDHANNLIIISSIIWSFCFALYLLIYTPYLFSKRPDGRT